MPDNLDQRTVSGFADEWVRFDQSGLAEDESLELFQNYFRIFPWTALPPGATGFDLGCGSGRWARHVAPRVGQLHCVDASAEALSVATRNLRGFENCVFHAASVSAIPLSDNSMDFGYSLGVLHHVPDTLEGIRCCVAKLKPGAPFLIYLYYAFDNRPAWFRLLWKSTDLLRRVVSKCPYSLRYGLSQLIAGTVYLPLARLCRLIERLGLNVSSLPLSYYRSRSFYTMRTDALDRFGTALEHRFTSSEIKQMLSDAGLERIVLSDAPPFWCALGYRTS
jgi:SAM-dependent methyltransferase